MIAITGATGQLGHATLQALLPKVASQDVVAVVRDLQKAQALTSQGFQVRTGDYDDPATLLSAFQGIDTLLLISTSETKHALRVLQHQHVIDAAKQTGVRHVLYTSVVNPSQHSAFGASASHLLTEDYLRASGLAYTVFRNTLYLNLVPLFVGAEAVSSGSIYFAAGEGRVSYVLREDIAQALANVLTTPGHENKIYDIAPGPTYSFYEVAAALSDVSSQPVQYVPISSADMAAGMRQHQVPESFMEVLSGIAVAMQDNEFNKSSSALTQLLGHEPTNLLTYLQSIYGK
jgi:NAD(P)H dehydrogenase (quinone)